MPTITADDLRAIIYSLQLPSAYATKLAIALIPSCWLLWAKKPRFAGLFLVNILIAIENLPSVLRAAIAVSREEFPTALTALGLLVFVCSSYCAFGAMRQGAPLFMPAQIIAAVGAALLFAGWTLFYMMG